MRDLRVAALLQHPTIILTFITLDDPALFSPGVEQAYELIFLENTDVHQ